MNSNSINNENKNQQDNTQLQHIIEMESFQNLQTNNKVVADFVLYAIKHHKEFHIKPIFSSRIDSNFADIDFAFEAKYDSTYIDSEEVAMEIISKLRSNETTLENLEEHLMQEIESYLERNYMEDRTKLFEDVITSFLEDYEDDNVDEISLVHMLEEEDIALYGDYQYIYDAILESELCVAIHNVLRSELSSDLETTANITEPLHALLSYEKDENGKIHSNLTDEERLSKWYELVAPDDVIDDDFIEDFDIKEANLKHLDNGLINLLSSQGILLRDLKTSSGFNKMLATVNHEFLDKLIIELDSALVEENLSMCYLAKLSVKDIIEIESAWNNENEQLDYFIIKSGNIMAGLINTISGSGSIMNLDRVKHDIEIPINQIIIQVEDDKINNRLGYTPNEIYGFSGEDYEQTKIEIKKDLRKQYNLDFDTPLKSPLPSDVFRQNTLRLLGGEEQKQKQSNSSMMRP